MTDLLNDLTPPEIPASSSKRYLLGLLDIALIMVISLGPAVLYSFINQEESVHVNVIVGVVLPYIAYRFISIYFFNRTIAMQLLKVKLLNGQEEKLSGKEKLFASFFILINGVDYYEIK